MTWQPLSRRSKGLEPDGPFEGVPAHLVVPLSTWVDSVFGTYGKEGAIPVIAMLLRYPVTPGRTDRGIGSDMIVTGRGNQEFLLDLVDATLQIYGEWNNDHENLSATLQLAGSVWTVSDRHDSLVRVVSDELAKTIERAASTDDAVSSELREAWANAYGRNGDSSDAWDHAIKALEAALTTVVVPNNNKATLGNVLGELRANRDGKWRSCFPGANDDHAVEPLVKTLEQIWPNIDRHQSGNSRPPTEAEARSVVALTAALIQAHRESPLVYKV